MLVSFMGFSVEYLKLDQLRQLQSERLMDLMGYLNFVGNFGKKYRKRNKKTGRNHHESESSCPGQLA